ncbi:MAG: polysaccharide deacetylase family protein [Chloroflexi bacterium]|nr:MAG: polysaccharide deacetylase family protein [Chloroflexota bacterium]
MDWRRTCRMLVPAPARAQVWRMYDYACQNWLATIVGVHTSQKLIALTFDDGPHPAFTPRLLELLAQYRARATFFMVGQHVEQWPNLARQVVQAGHEAGNHTFTHSRLVGRTPWAVAGELLRCKRAIRRATGVSPRLMRPPEGKQDVIAFLTARLLGYRVVHWSASAFDWRGDPAEVVTRRVLSGVGRGAIVLMHDGVTPSPGRQTVVSPDRTPTLKALPGVLGRIREKGYRFVTVSELLHTAPLIRESWFVM